MQNRGAICQKTEPKLIEPSSKIELIKLDTAQKPMSERYKSKIMSIQTTKEPYYTSRLLKSHTTHPYYSEVKRSKIIHSTQK